MNYALFQLINNLAGQFDWIDDMMEVFANGLVWVMIGILALLWLTGRESNQRLAFYACLSALVALAFASLAISPIVAHPRPFVEHPVHQLIRHNADPSFPSDHATLSFSLAFTVWFARRRIGWVLLALAILTGFARIYVGVHYPADILGGALLAFASSLLVVKLRSRMEPLPSFFISIYNRIAGRICR